MHTSELVTSLGAPIAKRGGAITIRRNLEAHRGSLVAQRRHDLAVMTRSRTYIGAPPVSDGVAARREVIVRGMLIVFCASLVAITCRLVAIRPCLILIARRLIAIRRCLIVL